MLTSIRKKLNEVSVDPKSGVITVKTTRSFEESLKITLIVGSQEISSQAFKVLVYDCSRLKELEPGIKVQITSRVKKYSAYVLNVDKGDCEDRIFSMEN